MSSEPVSKDQIFDLAAEISDPDQQRKLLDELCGNDVRLREQIEDLLSIDGKLGNFLEPDAGNRTSLPGETVTINPDDRHSGSTIGDYQIKEVIGQGGMGAVYLARQSQPIKRSVALKVIRSGLDSRNVLARFAAERQALALMNHPNIARIVDVGTTDDGQPWFAMELVPGPPATRYCDDNRLSIEDRLKLFVDVCSGVQHAHQKGVIHRDLKPSNILVAQVDGRPVPKVIDFGLAKALESTQQLTDESLHTQIGQIVGTLKYMSPEQATLDLVDIDTRTDIYSLGVVLYELLTGSTPLDDDTISSKSVLEVLELIREEDPVKPSRRLSSSGERAREIAQQRRTDSGSLNRILIGDLDWVVGKALEKDRSRRYETAAALANDVRRFLNNEPVNARAPSASYQIAKFVKRNRFGVLAALLMLTAFVIATFTTSYGMLTAQAALTEKTKALKDRQLALEQKDLALLDAQRTIWQYIETIQQASKSEVSGDKRLVPFFRKLVEEASSHYKRVTRDFQLDASQRPSLAEAFSQIGILQQGLGDLDKSLDSHANAARLRRDSLSLDPDNTDFQLALARSLDLLANALHATGDSGRSKRHFNEAIALVRPFAEKGIPEFLNQLATTSSSLALAEYRDGRKEEAIKLVEQSASICERLLEDKPSNAGHLHDLVRAKVNLAMMVGGSGKLEDAIDLHIEVDELLEKLLLMEPDDDIRRSLKAGNLSNLAMSYMRVGQPAKGVKMLEEACETGRQVAEKNPEMIDLQSDVASWLNNLGLIHESLGKREAARDAFEASITIQSAIYEDFPDRIRTAVSLGGSCMNLGNLETKSGNVERSLELSTLSKEVLAKAVELSPERQKAREFLRNAIGLHALNLQKLGRFQESVANYEQAISLTKEFGDEKMVEWFTERMELAEQGEAKWNLTTPSDR